MINPKSLEPNNLPFWQSMTKHTYKMNCSNQTPAQLQSIALIQFYHNY